MLAPAKRFLGFTLLEILVVMAIIGVLAAIGFGAFGTVQLKARDAKRKSDLENIARALEMYYNDKKEYPAADAGGAITGGAWDGPWTVSGTTYMQRVPKDSKFGYRYEDVAVNSVPKKGYRLFARLENTEDEKIANTGSPNFKAAHYVDGSNVDYACGTAKCNYVIMSTNLAALGVVAD